MQESWEEMGEGHALQGQQWWGRERKTSWAKLRLFGEEGPFYRSPKNRAVAGKLLRPETPVCLDRRLRPPGDSGVTPDPPSEAAVLRSEKRNAQTGDSGPRPETPARKNCSNTEHENEDILSIRTLFLMFLGSLESPQRAL